MNGGFDHGVGNRNGDGRDADGELPWASMFDPAANMRALTEIQAQGMRAAGQLVNRFVRGDAADAAPCAPASDRRAETFGALDMEPLVRSWWSMFGQFLAGPPGQVADPVAGAPSAVPMFDFRGSRASGALELDLPVPGVVTAEIWLHNLGIDDFGEVTLRCSELLADHGGVLRATLVSFRPARIPMPGRCSRGIDVRIEADPAVRPGRYRGTVLAERFPDLWLPVVVTVRGPAR